MPPWHGGDRGSTPRRSTKIDTSSLGEVFVLVNIHLWESSDGASETSESSRRVSRSPLRDNSMATPRRSTKKPALWPFFCGHMGMANRGWLVIILYFTGLFYESLQQLKRGEPAACLPAGRQAAGDGASEVKSVFLPRYPLPEEHRKEYS